MSLTDASARSQRSPRDGSGNVKSRGTRRLYDVAMASRATGDAAMRAIDARMRKF